jgi:hypothetical protein
MNGPENLYGILKQIKFFRGLKGTRHASVGKRIRILEETGFVRKAGFKKTKAGIETPIYEVTAKALIALLLDKFSLEELLNRLNESLIFQTIVTVFSEEEPKSQQ